VVRPFGALTESSCSLPFLAGTQRDALELHFYTLSGVLIGLSDRTNRVSSEALISSIEKLGRKARIAETPKGVLHSKTPSSLLDGETIIATATLADAAVFESFRKIVVREGEEPAANVLRVNDVVFASANYPRTLEELDRQGYKVVPLKTAEIERLTQASPACRCAGTATAGRPPMVDPDLN